MKLEFKQELKGTSVSISNVNCLFGTKGVDYELQDVKAFIEYSVELDIRRWGIDGITLNVDKAIVSADINIPKEDLSADEIELLRNKGFKEYEQDLTLFNWELLINNDITVDYGCLKISQISINELSVELSLINNDVVANGVVT